MSKDVLCYKGDVRNLLRRQPLYFSVLSSAEHSTKRSRIGRSERSDVVFAGSWSDGGMLV